MFTHAPVVPILYDALANGESWTHMKSMLIKFPGLVEYQLVVAPADGEL